MIKHIFSTLLLVLLFTSARGQTWQELFEQGSKQPDAESAIPFIEKALLQAEVEFGSADQAYWQSFGYLISLYRAVNKYEELSVLLAGGLEKFEANFGKEIRDYRVLLSNLGSLYMTMGQYEKALRIQQDVMAHADKYLSKDDPEYGICLSSLAMAYRSNGLYNQSLPLLEQALVIMGNQHPYYLFMLNELANIYANLGQYEKAKLSYEEVLQGVNVSDDAALYIKTVNNLAFVYERMGQYERAVHFYRQSLDKQAELSGNNNAEYGTILSNLAIVLMRMGEYEQALPLLQEALAITGTTLGEGHPYYSNRLSNLGNLFEKMGQNDKALQLMQDAVDNAAETLSQNHPNIGAYLYYLGKIYAKIGQFDKAVPLLHAAADNIRNALGRDHSSYRDVLDQLSFAYAHTDRLGPAEQFADTALQLTQQLIGRAVRYSSESDLAELQAQENQPLREIPSWMHSGRFSVGISQLVCNDILFQKGFLLDAAMRLRRLSAVTPEADSLADLLRSYRVQLSKEYVKPVAERSGVDELEEKANAVEGILSRTVAGYADASRQVKWEEVRDALKPGEAALEFIHFPLLFPEKTDGIRYGALLIKPGDTSPRYIPLFDAAELNHLLADRIERKEEYVNKLYASAQRGLIPAGEKTISLYELIWKPIEAAGLEGISTIYCAPSGILHRLNLAAISASVMSTLGNKFRFAMLNSTRQLVLPVPAATYNNMAVLLGGIDYGDGTDIASLDRSSVERWGMLEYTTFEVDEIAAILAQQAYTTQVLRGKDATEEAFKRLGAEGPSPRILHIATHGFFSPKPQPADSSSMNDSELAFKRSDLPLLRSGLILADGNYAWQQGRARMPAGEDGILTAYEISQMNFANTELVVLSACETNLGDIEGNEGVYGLQRAFRIAGARYLIMSIWKVDDKKTKVFMANFYRHLSVAGTTVPEAFRKTQLQLQEVYSHYDWAGFVLIE